MKNVSVILNHHVGTAKLQLLLLYKSLMHMSSLDLTIMGELYELNKDAGIP